MAQSIYKYDVAFSFLAQDEALAMQMNDRLQDRVKTFIYSERQKEIAGTDGEETFGRVFREESLLVVVLYRAAWGETKWTRVEQTAIRARGFDHGHDFVKFIPLDDPAKVPPWLPPTHIYIGLKRFGVDGAAAVIEQRIRELGGHAHQETVEEHAQRLERSLEFSKRREQFAWDVGAREAAERVEELPDLLRAVAESIQRSSSILLKVQVERSMGTVTYLGGLRQVFAITWHRQYANKLTNSDLRVSLMSHLPSGPGRWVIEQPTVSKTWHFKYDLMPSETGGWIESEARSRNFSNSELAEHLVRLYMQHGT